MSFAQFIIPNYPNFGKRNYKDVKEKSTKDDKPASAGVSIWPNFLVLT